MKDIANVTGLGLATVSSYFNGGNVREKNRLKIEAAIEDLDFEVNEVARGLKTNRTRTVGIILPELNNVFFAEIITEAEDALRAHGYATMICDCRSDPDREVEAADFLLHRRVDGLIIMPAGDGGTIPDKFESVEKPVVMIDRRPKGTVCSSVMVDNEGAAKNAVNKLIEAGHRRIGIITGPDTVSTAKERYAGYLAALEEASKAPSINSKNIDESFAECGFYTIAGGSAAVKKLLERHPDMTAVFISNYEMTVGAMMEINELGVRVPDDLSVIGFDNPDFAKAVSPRLSIVTQPTKEIGREAARILLERLDEASTDAEKRGPVTVCLETGFIEGRSVRAV